MKEIAPDAGIIETLASNVRIKESDAEISIEFHSAVW
jgi:hypothetical protein